MRTSYVHYNHLWIKDLPSAVKISYFLQEQ